MASLIRREKDGTLGEIRRYVMIVDARARKTDGKKRRAEGGRGWQVRSLGDDEDAFLSAQLP